MNGVAACLPSGFDHGIDIQIGAGAHAIERYRLVGLADVQRALVVFGIDGDRGNL